jgi:signal transduction histidine kinase
MFRHVGKVIQEAWNDLAANRVGRDVQLVEKVTCDDLRCEIDPFAMGQVFRNIFDNALAACADPVVVTVHYRAKMHDGASSLEIAIHNNGPALTAKQREKVFEPFFTTKRTGTGLGMAIASRIVDAHHGQISVNSPERTGAEFVIVMPRKQT